MLYYDNIFLRGCLIDCFVQDFIKLFSLTMVIFNGRGIYFYNSVSLVIYRNGNGDGLLFIGVQPITESNLPLFTR